MSTFTILSGQKQCATYHFLGDKGHFIPRSNHVRFDDGLEGVYCVFCGIDHVGLTSTIEALVHGSGSYREPIRQDSPHEHRFVFSYAGTDRAVVSYENVEQFDIKPQPIGQAYDRQSVPTMPSDLDRLAKALQAVGYRVMFPITTDHFHQADAGALKRILMVRGERLFPEQDEERRNVVTGVHVELSWIVGESRVASTLASTRS